MAQAIVGWHKPEPVPDEHSFTHYLQARGGSLFLDNLDLAGILHEGVDGNRFQSPLEIVYLPIIRERIQALRRVFADAIAAADYPGEFFYTYASKANAAEEVIRTVLKSGTNLEISSWVDVEIVKNMRSRGIFSDDKLVISNGFKQPGSLYAQKLVELQTLRGNVIPVIEAPEELAAFKDAGQNFELGLRLKSYGHSETIQAMDAVNSRFGMDLDALTKTADAIESSPHLKLRLLHAMVGSQITDPQDFVARLAPAMEIYAQLRQKHPNLEFFDFGGGVPVQQTLDFSFDYPRMAVLLLEQLKRTCSRYNVPVPNIVGEMGRYTVGEHGAHIFKVIGVKQNNSKLPWYIINGSIMSSFPDTWALGENFIVLPINHLDEPFQQVQLGGITCDSDDIYPSHRSSAQLFLPQTSEDLYVGFFNIGAYQEMLGGAGGSKHCVIPEADELVIDKDSNGSFVFTKMNGQTSQKVLQNLGYH